VRSVETPSGAAFRWRSSGAPDDDAFKMDESPAPRGHFKRGGRGVRALICGSSAFRSFYGTEPRSRPAVLKSRAAGGGTRR